MQTALVFAALLALAQAAPLSVRDTSPAGFVRMTAHKNNRSSLSKREDGVVSLDLENEKTFYMSEVEIGSNTNKVGLLVDTGSSDMWVVGSDNSYCKSGTSGSLKSRDTNEIDCSQYGTFDPSGSKSFHDNGTDFSILYADQTFAKGTWAQDTVDFNGISIKSVNFAVCNETDNAMGVLGIGLPGLEVTATGSGSSYEYENFPLKLVSDGLINKAAYSVYLDDDSDSAEVLFGAVNAAKFKGSLVQLPMVRTDSSKSGQLSEIAVTLNSLSYIDNEDSTEATIAEGAIAALLDTGTTLSYMPRNILDAITLQMKLSFSGSLGYYTMPCSYGDKYSFDFEFQGLKIEVPLKSFSVSLVDGSGATSDTCALGIKSSTGSYITLGDSFLKSAYMVVDLEGLTISLAQGTGNADDDDILVINNDIPQAKQPSNTETYGPGNNAFTTVRYPYLSDIQSRTWASDGDDNSSTTSSPSSTSSSSSASATATSSSSSSSTSTTSSSSTLVSTTSSTSSSTNASTTTTSSSSSSSTTTKSTGSSSHTKETSSVTTSTKSESSSSSSSSVSSISSISSKKNDADVTIYNTSLSLLAFILAFI